MEKGTIRGLTEVIILGNDTFIHIFLKHYLFYNRLIF
jgi:hypothetical protein